jgi:hypothetical protein
MDHDELFASLAEAAPSPEEIVYVERRGISYAWHRVSPGAEPPVWSPGPDVWMYFSGPWPQHSPARLREFCADMLAEMESMAGGADRCRWPVDQPWPMMH